MTRSLLFCVLILKLACGESFAGIEVIRDNIGADSSSTDGLPGASTVHDGSTWNTPGMIVDVPNTGLLTEMQIVMFARDVNYVPENDLANILGYGMRFHVWSDGIQGGPDSFNDNAVGDNGIPGHIEAKVNTQFESFISAEPFGVTGPANDPEIFTTFLITIDLSSFAIELQGGQQYVVGITELEGGVNNWISGGGSYRIIRSSVPGSEDLLQYSGMPADWLPGFLGSQLPTGFKQHAGKISLENGDHNGNKFVDGIDYLQWQRGESSKPLSSFDLAAWELNYGEGLVGPLGAAVTTPEPSTLLLVSIASCVLLQRRRRV